MSDMTVEVVVSLLSETAPKWVDIWAHQDMMPWIGFYSAGDQYAALATAWLVDGVWRYQIIGHQASPGSTDGILELCDPAFPEKFWSMLKKERGGHP